MKYNLKPYNRGATDQELIDDLRRVAALVPNARMTLGFYEGNGRFTTSMVLRRFRGWNNALGRAGLSPVQVNNIPDEMWFKNIANVWDYLGRQPSYGDMRNAPSVYSPSGYACRFGGWRLVLEAFVDFMGTRTFADEITKLGRR